MLKKINKSIKNKVKIELKRLFKSMDFVSNNFLNTEDISKYKFQMYFNIYQQLGLAWEFLGLQCKHWDGYKKIKNGEKVCKICGKLKDKAEILNDTIKFHGALLNVDAHNSYKSNLLRGKNEINIAPERIVSLRERGIKCYIDGHLVSIELPSKGRKIGKEKYGGFAWEIKRKKLKNFPVIFDFDEKYKLLGLTILT